MIQRNLFLSLVVGITKPMMITPTKPKRITTIRMIVDSRKKITEMAIMMPISITDLIFVRKVKPLVFCQLVM